MGSHGQNLWAVWPGLFIVSAGIMSVLPQLPLYMETAFGLVDPEEAQLWASLAFGAAPFAAAVMGPIWGVLGDRWGKRPMVLRATLAIAIVMALMPWARSPLELVLLRGLQGAFAGYVAPAMALGSAGTPAHRQGRVLGRLQMALALGTLVGPQLGAELGAQWGLRTVFWISAVLALLAALPIAIWAREPDRTPVSERVPLARDFRDSGAALARNRVFVGLFALLVLLRAGQHMVEPSVALFVQELGPLTVLGEGRAGVARTVGWSFGVLAVAQLLTTSTWGGLADRIGPLRCLSILSLGLAVTMAATGFADSIEWFFGWRCVGALFMAGGMTLAYAAASRRVEPERRTLAFSVVQSGLQFGMALGPAFGVKLAAWLSGEGLQRSALYWVGATVLAVAGLGMVALRRAAGAGR